MVKNELDIIEETLRHLADQDIDEILVADNGSSDGTLERLRELTQELPLHVALDEEPRYFQAAKMTALAQVAGRAGASWVVPFDADEFWFANERSLGQFLRESDAGVVTARLFNVFPQEDGDAWRLDPVPGDLPKVAFRPHRLARLAVGNHWITHPGRPGSGLYIAHYPWRSAKQLRLKTHQGAQALTARQREDGIGWHWTAAATAADAWLDDAWSAIEHGQRFDQLHWTPSGQPLWDVDPRRHSTWTGPES
jgi:glycosyltransferase involved in cell wall biosynthesis